MSDEEKSAVEKAMELDCILLVIASIIVTRVSSSDPFNTKCRGPACAQYKQFANVCGLS